MNYPFNKKGSIIFGTLIFGTAISLITSSLLKSGISEFNINERYVGFNDANNAAESVAEFGLAQLVNRWQKKTDFSTDELSANKSPVTIPAHIVSFFDNTLIDTAKLTVDGGDISPQYWYFIDPDDPLNEDDPDKGKNVLARDVSVYSKAYINLKRSGETLSTYASKVLQVRDTPIFAHLIYYNMDMEFHPGPEMNMTGPVHSNGNIYANTGSSLYFHDAVTTSGAYIHGNAPGNPVAPYTGNVYFKDRSGSFVSDYKGSGSRSDPNNFYSSNDSDWKSKAMELWGGSIKTEDHSVLDHYFISLEKYVRDNPDTAQVDDALNSPYSLIEPNLVTNKLNDSRQKGEGEEQKFAYKSGLIVRLTHHPDIINNQSDLPNRAHVVSDNYYVSFHKIKRTSPSDPNSPPKLKNDKLDEKDIKVTAALVTDLFNMQEYGEDSLGKPNSGLWDARRGKGISTLEFDINKLRKAVDNTDPGYQGGGNYYWKKEYDPAKDYNGIVYVEFPTDTSTPSRPDMIVTSTDNLGLLVKDATKVPNPNFQTDAGPGFTLATNNTVYIKGHFNADGVSNTGSSTDPDSSGASEPPASIAADTITVLSNRWDATKSKYTNPYYRTAEFTEINAGFIQGVTPTNKAGNGARSGGVHNFVRLLESWTGHTLRFRGSMVALYENEIATEPQNTAIYRPPARDFGFYNKFKEGKFPPGTPMSRTFRRVAYRKLSKTKYDADAPIPDNGQSSGPPKKKKKKKKGK